MIFRAEKELDTIGIIDEIKALGYTDIACHGNHPDGYCEVEIYDEVEWDQAKEDEVNQALTDHNKTTSEENRQKKLDALAWAKEDGCTKNWDDMETYHRKALNGVELSAGEESAMITAYEATL